MSSLPPDIEQALRLHELEWPSDPALQHAMLDRPFMFGDCPMDCIQGALNIARNAETIVLAPQLPQIAAPVIAIGSGPSLAYHLDAIRALQHKCLIIASLSAVRGLRAAGIEPHLATPIERTEDVIQYMPDCGPVGFAGAPLVARSVCRAFRSHYYVPNTCGLSMWASLPTDTSVYYGSSTGTTAVSVGCSLTKAPVYLVGHDLVFDNDRSHWDQAQNTPVKVEGKALANNGDMLPTTWLWLRFIASIGGYARDHGNVINTNTPDRRGAAIPNTHSGYLPDPSTLPDFSLPYGERVPERLNRLKGLLRKLPHDVRHALKRFEAATAMEGIDIAKAVPGPNGMMLAYVLGSVYVQLSYELQMKTINVAQSLDWGKTALTNVLRESRGIFDEMATYG